MGGEDIPAGSEQPLASEEERGSNIKNNDPSAEGRWDKNVTAMRRSKLSIADPDQKLDQDSERPAILNKVRDNRGRYLTMALFAETIGFGSKYAPTYTLNEFDRNGLPSARRIYLELNDPTEYSAAMSLLGSWEHWQHLCGTPWFAPIVEAWREELKVRLLSEATKKVIEHSVGYESSASLAASKKIMEIMDPKAKSKSAPRRSESPSNERSKETNTNPVGRPPKPPVLNEVSDEDTDADLARILELG